MIHTRRLALSREFHLSESLRIRLICQSTFLFVSVSNWPVQDDQWLTAHRIRR